MTQKQEFLGGLIAGKVIEKVVGLALDKVAKSPSISLQPKDVPAVEQIVAEAVKTELGKREEHITNSEPVYQSRVAQGTLAAFLFAAGGTVQLWTDGLANTPQDYVPHVVVIIGTAWALYGRFIAKKPFGA